MFSHMAADRARVRIVAATGREADDETNGFAFVEIALRVSGRRHSTGKNTNVQEQKEFRKSRHTLSLWRALSHLECSLRET
jgi:hypothetical protein